MVAGVFGTAINCIDGRVQEAVIAWMKGRFGLNYVDLITEPGPDRELAQGWLKGIDLKAKAALSAQAHGSRVIAIAGHFDCARNPVSRDDHWTQIRRSVAVIRDWRLFPTIAGLWINDHWQIEVVDLIEPPP
jgi:hypothetical protein